MDRWVSLVFLIGLCSPEGPLSRAARQQIEHTAMGDGTILLETGTEGYAVSFDGELPQARPLGRLGWRPIAWDGTFDVGAGGPEIDILGAAAAGANLFWLIRQDGAPQLLAARKRGRRTRGKR